MIVKVLLADDHRIVREGLRTLLEMSSECQVVADASNGREAIALAKQYRPDVAILDLGMPELNGIDAIREIKRIDAPIRTIALSMHSDKRYVSEAIKAGASGYLLKDCASEELRTAINYVMAGQVYLSPKIAGVLVGEFLNKEIKNDTPLIHRLSSREREVLQLLAEGTSTKQIASVLHVSTKTIETHRLRIMEKLSIHSIAELTKFAIREGLTSLEE